MIAIIDYGLGNIQSFVNIYKKLNIPVKVSDNAEQLKSANKLILPGVGSFDWAMYRLENSGMRSALQRLVIENKMPILGVCVGMQMMANSSEEGSGEGLGWINARVKKFRSSGFDYKKPLPHMGWNKVDSNCSSTLFKNLESDMRFYFCILTIFPQMTQMISLAFPATEIVSYVLFSEKMFMEYNSIQKKSHGWGIQLLKNFAQT